MRIGAFVRQELPTRIVPTPSIFSCYEGRLTSSFSRAVGLCFVATLAAPSSRLLKASFQPVEVLNRLRWVGKVR